MIGSWISCNYTIPLAAKTVFLDRLQHLSLLQTLLKDDLCHKATHLALGLNEHPRSILTELQVVVPLAMDAQLEIEYPKLPDRDTLAITILIARSVESHNEHQVVISNEDECIDEGFLKNGDLLGLEL